MAPFFIPVGMLLQEGPQIVRVDEKLTVTAKHVNYKRELLTFDDGVVAVYGVTTVYGDHLQVIAARSDSGVVVRKAIAKGHVRLVDPEGEVRAEEVEFDWIEETGKAKSAKLTLADMEVSASTIDIRKEELKLFDVAVSLCSGKEVGLGFRELSVNRNGTGIGRGIRLAIAGRSAMALAHYRFSFRDDGNQSGLGRPKILLNGKSAGVSWSPEAMVGPRTLIDGGISARQGRELSGKIYITQSLLPEKWAFRGPKSGSVDPYSYGFMENISTRSIERELEYARKPRATISVGTAWNQGRYSDQVGGITKPFEAILEGSGPVGSWGLFGQARFQRVDVPGTSPLSRWEVLGSLSPPSAELTNTLKVFGRADFRSEIQPGEDYSWLRGQVGVSVRAAQGALLSVAYSRAADRGKPLFAFDKPTKDEALHLRGDFEFGPTKIAGLAKFEPGTRKPFSTEVYLSQIAGCLELFAIWKETPRTFSVGFKLRSLEKIADAGDRIGKRTRGNNNPSKP